MQLRLRLVMLVLTWLGAPAAGQSAEVRVSHDDPNGSVLPGQTISMTTTVSWQGAWQFAGLKGSARATSSLGVAGSVGSVFGPPSPIVVFGTPVLGDVVGHDIIVIPGFFTTTPHPASLQSGGMEFLTYDWTAPAVAAPTLVEFHFVAAALAPNVRLYPGDQSPAFIEAQTTYLGTSVLVLPAPASLAAIAGAAGFAARRARAGRGVSGAGGPVSSILSGSSVHVGVDRGRCPRLLH